MKRLTLIATLVATPIALMAPMTGADDAANIKLARAEAEVALAAEAVGLESACGTPIEVKIDWDGFPEDTLNYSVAGYCETLANALGYHCEGGKEKQRWISENVATLVCAYDSEASETPGVIHDESQITGTFSFGMSNLDDKFRYALLESL